MNPEAEGMRLPDVVLQVLQVVTVLAFSPLITGLLKRIEEIVESKRGPSVLQPYYDLRKLFQKEWLIPRAASPIFLLAPFVVFTAMIAITLLIPVLTDFPLPLGFMGDMLGGAFLFTLASFMVTLAGMDTGSPHGGLGASRSTFVAILAEPTLILVLIGVALIAQSTLPYVVIKTLVAGPAAYFNPAHLLIVTAFFLLFLADTDRLPLHSDTHVEISMIEEARILEYSGWGLALLKWASHMKQFLLLVVFCNVLLLPWGLSHSGTIPSVVWAVVTLLLKMTVIVVLVVIVQTSISRLRFFRYQEYLGASFILALLAIIAHQLTGS
jgi:formate hydrogenlyase subunit 4